MADNRKRKPVQRQYKGRVPDYEDRGKDVFLWCLLFLMAILLVAGVIFAIWFINNSDNENNEPKSTQTMVDTKSPLQTETKPEQTSKPTETSAPDDGKATLPTFKADLTGYEQYMNPTGDQRDAYLILVNSTHPLAENYVPEDLVDVASTRKDSRKTQQMRLYAAKALEAMMKEADAWGIITDKTPSGFPLSVMSAYRSYSYQGTLFNTYTDQEMSRNTSLTRAQAEAIVATYSNRPGTSEHQSGLCCDMHTLPSAEQSFKNEKEAKWLAENCWKFGFILRYPENKMEQTGGIMYEPWHFRYVGRYHAEKIYKQGLCLEEYLAANNY